MAQDRDGLAGQGRDAVLAAFPGHAAVRAGGRGSRRRCAGGRARRRAGRSGSLSAAARGRAGRARWCGRGREQRFDLVVVEVVRSCARWCRLAGSRSRAPIVCGVLGVAQRGVPVERVDRRQPGVAGAGAVAAVVLEVVEERADQRRVEVGEVESAGLLAGLLWREAQQQPERVAVGGDRARARVLAG